MSNRDYVHGYSDREAERLHDQAGKPAIAFTSEMTPELMKTITHTRKDTPGILDSRKLVDVASAINNLISQC